MSGAWVKWKSYPIKTKLGYHKSPIPGDGRGLAEGEELEAAEKKGENSSKVNFILTSCRVMNLGP